jgi:hypothetical protein
MTHEEIAGTMAGALGMVAEAVKLMAEGIAGNDFEIEAIEWLLAEALGFTLQNIDGPVEGGEDRAALRVAVVGFLNAGVEP